MRISRERRLLELRLCISREIRVRTRRHASHSRNTHSDEPKCAVLEKYAILLLRKRLSREIRVLANQSVSPATDVKNIQNYVLLAFALSGSCVLDLT